MAASHRHHFISKCYLKGFTHDGTKSGRLFVINAGDGTSFITTPLNVGVERDFNSVEGRPTGELESKISEIESDFCAALDRVIKMQSIEHSGDWQAVLTLFALFAVRNPRLRNTLGEFASETSKIIISLLISTPERWGAHIAKLKDAGVLKKEHLDIPYDQVKRFHDSGEYDIDVSRGYRIRLEFEAIDSILQTLVIRKWTLLIAEAGTGDFITTDHPVCLTNGDGTPSSLQEPFGYGTKGTAVIVPISKGLVAVGTFTGKPAVVTATKLQVALMNAIIAPFAERQIYAAHDQFPILINGKLSPVSGSEFANYLAQSKRN